MDKKENIVFLFPDQLRFDALSCNGCKAISTPNMDSLAQEGVNFTRAISPTPLCVPARASLMTGVDSIETGVIDNLAWLRPDRKEMGYRTWPERLTDAGYKTAAIGKMHFYPWDLGEGFQKRVIAEDKRHIHILDDYQKELRSLGYKKIHGKVMDGYVENKGAVVNTLPSELQVDNWVADKTIDYLREVGDETFAMMVGFPGPHCPYDPMQEYLDKVDVSKIDEAIPVGEDWMVKEAVKSNLRPWNGIDYTDLSTNEIKKVRHHYLALVKQIDDAVGKILDYLKDNNLMDSTTIILSADHGDFLGDRGLIGKRYFYDQATHIPMLIKGRDFHGGRTVNENICLTDIYDIILNISGVGAEDRRRDGIYGYLDSGYFAAVDKWRYSRYHNGERYLFNIEDDPAEENNLIEAVALKYVIEDIETGLMKWISNSLILSNSDKRLIPGTNDPGHDFYKESWDRPYPGSLELAENLLEG